MHVHIMDTSVLCNVIQIPNRCQNQAEVIQELKYLHADASHVLILPLAAMIETGNFIAHISEGRVRREKARLMAELIEKTVREQAPWQYYGKEFEPEELLTIASGLVDHAVAEVGLGDLSIIQVYNKYKETFLAIGSIRIWSLDSHLSSYSEQMDMPKRRKNL